MLKNSMVIVQPLHSPLILICVSSSEVKVIEKDSYHKKKEVPENKYVLAVWAWLAGFDIQRVASWGKYMLALLEDRFKALPPSA